MSPTDLESLITLHSAFWNRTLDRPIVNHELSQTTRFRHIPALPAPWRDQDGLVLEPDMLSPAAFQPPPMRVSEANPALGRVAFNTMVPYLRVPWPGQNATSL